LGSLTPGVISIRTTNGDQDGPKRRADRSGNRGAPKPDLSAETGQEDSGETPAKPKRRRGSRGGRRHRRGAEKAADGGQEPGAASSPAPAAPEVASRQTRRRSSRPRPAAPPATTDASQATGQRPTRQPTRARARIPVTGAPTDQVPEPFAHNAEYELARILDFYGIDWQYEPRSFPLRWERGHVTEAFTPDFYLPDLNLYVELTTLKSSLTAEKNRKMRLLKELYPEVNVIMLKKRDYLRLLAKYGYGPLSPGQVPDIDRVLLTATKIQQRVGALGAEISRDYAGKEPVLVGVLRGVLCFIADLMRHISVPTAMDLMAISSYEGNGAGAVRILKDLDENIKGRDVILVEDIVDTGMTLNHIIDYLQTKRPASIRVCTLLDKRARRIVNVPLDYVAFEIPDEFVVGYGLDFHQRFRNLPFIAILKHELLP
jgi:hypoxanthine phosphoribosyltransferase